MDQRVHFITVSTLDLDATRRFYVDGLGWAALADVPGEIIFFQVGPGTTLGFFDAEKFAADIGIAVPVAAAPSGFTLSHNVASPAEVDRVMGDAAAAGAAILKPAQQAAFGGYHGHFADPNATVWEVAYNPGWRVDDDATVRLVAADDH